jgi:hypothetical protein
MLALTMDMVMATDIDIDMKTNPGAEHEHFKQYHKNSGGIPYQ